ncbi:MAG: response regulator transcription factor [Brevirhabdus sp.]
MEPSENHRKNISALITSTDTETRLTFRYMFSVVFENRTVVTANSGKEALDFLDGKIEPDALIVDGDGIDDDCLVLVNQASALARRPTIFVIEPRNPDNCATKAFAAGADDVIRRPFDLRELGYRMLVRMGRRMDIPKIAQDRLDWNAEAFLAHEAHLTTVEAQVLRMLIHKDGEIVTRDEMSQAIDNRPWKYGDRKFDVHVAKIRKKLHAAFGTKIEVQTVHAAGYQMTVDDDSISRTRF